MLRASVIAAVVLGFSGIVSAAGIQHVFINGHDPNRRTQAFPVIERPYALTGERGYGRTPVVHLRVGSRIIPMAVQR